MNRLTHFLFHSSDFSSNGVKHKALLPSEKTLRKSVFCIDGLNEAGIWECGQWVEQKRIDGVSLKARGDLPFSAVEAAGLKLLPDATYHPLHANIIGWPEDKGERVAKAQLLRDYCKLVPRPSVPPEEQN